MNYLWMTRGGTLGCIAISTFMIMSVWVYTYKGNPTFPTVMTLLPKEEFSQRATYNLTFSSLGMAQRKIFIRDRCKEIRSRPGFDSNKPRKARVLLDKKSHLIACNNFKVGSTTISYIMHQLNNKTVVGRTVSYKIFRAEVLAHTLPIETINAYPYKTFMFVRDPFERLLSAYRDDRDVAKSDGKKVSFLKFLTDILNTDGARVNNHHMTYYDRCSPCNVEYNYFGSMETFYEDMKFILQEARIDIDIPHRNTNSKNISTDMAIRKLPQYIKHKIWKRYFLDYYIFGYPYPKSETKP